MIRRALKTRTSKPRGLKEGYRSGLEEKMGAELKSLSLPYLYEAEIIRYTQPEKNRKYTPDFTFKGSSIIIETKGRFVTADRQKHLLIQAQHPEKDIRFVFSNPNARISKLSETTYAMWCDKYGFKYAKQSIPLAWLAEIRKQIKENK
jgi:hypothetical protein